MKIKRKFKLKITNNINDPKPKNYTINDSREQALKIYAMKKTLNNNKIVKSFPVRVFLHFGRLYCCKAEILFKENEMESYS